MPDFTQQFRDMPAIGRNRVETLESDDDTGNHQSNLQDHRARGQRVSGGFEMERTQVEDMIAVSEARTDVKFAKLEGKLDLLIEETRHGRTETAHELSFVRERLSEGRDDQRSTRNTVIATVIPSALALAAFIFALWQELRDPPQARGEPTAITYNRAQPEAAPAPSALSPPSENKS